MLRPHAQVDDLAVVVLVQIELRILRLRDVRERVKRVRETHQRQMQKVKASGGQLDLNSPDGERFVLAR